MFLEHVQVCYVGLASEVVDWKGRISAGLWFNVEIDFMVLRGILPGCSCPAPFIMLHGCLNKRISKWVKCIPRIPVRRLTTYIGILA